MCVPCDVAREGGVHAGYNEESTKVLHPDADVGDVDGETDQGENQPRENEWGTHLEAIGQRSPQEDVRGWDTNTV